MYIQRIPAYTTPPAKGALPARPNVSFSAAMCTYNGTTPNGNFNVLATVVDATGNVKYRLDGSKGFMLPIRSAAKPFQAIPLIRQLQQHKIMLSPQEIAAICSSHSGSQEVVETIDKLLNKNGLSKTHLQCGDFMPLDEQHRNELIKKGCPASPLYHPCSGNHTGALLTTQLLNGNVAEYKDPQGVSNQAVLAELKAIFETNQIEVGEDTCGMPAYTMPIEKAALAYAKLVSDINYISIVKAMTQHPDYISGDDIDNRLMTVTQGRLLAKTGADGTLCVGNTETKEGFVLRVENWNEDVKKRASIKLLADLGWLTVDETAQLHQQFPVEIKGNTGRPIGHFGVDELNWEKPTHRDASTVLRLLKMISGFVASRVK